MSNATSFDRGHTFNVVVSVPLSRTEVWGSHGRPPFTTPLHNQSHIDCHEEDELVKAICMGKTDLGEAHLLNISELILRQSD
ncbi:hypothetical protein V6N13_016878 [Hibiscus sabdariffa]